MKYIPKEFPADFENVNLILKGIHLSLDFKDDKLIK